MTTRSTIRIEQEMFKTLEDLMKKTIKGDFFLSGMRPDNALTEDAVLTVSFADAGQIEQGKARLNIFVPNIDCGYPSKVADKARLDQLASADQSVVETLNEADTDYLFELAQATQTFSVEGKEEHFVNITMAFKLVTFSEEE